MSIKRKNKVSRQPTIKSNPKSIIEIASTLNTGIVVMRTKFKQQRARLEQLLEATRIAARDGESDINLCAEIEENIIAFLGAIDEIIVALQI